MTAFIGVSLLLLLLATRHVLGRERWWCENVRGRALLLAGAVALIVIIAGGVM